MKRILKLLGSLFGLLALAALVIVLTTTLRDLRASPQPASQVFQSPIETPTQPPYPPPSTPMASPSPVPTITATPTPTPLPPIAWESLPSCANHPQDVIAWRAYVANRNKDTAIAQELAAYLREAKPMSKALQGIEVDNLEAVLRTSDEAGRRDVIRRELAVLWLNVISGRLNRATEVKFSGLAEVRTVGDLIEQLEKAWLEGKGVDRLMAASKSLQTGNGVVEPICAKLINLQWGNAIGENTWSNEEWNRQDRFSQPTDQSFPWITSRLIPSPNYQWAAIETGTFESGGPIYLLNLGTNELVNLHRLVKSDSSVEGITLQGEHEYWYVIGWHPDSSHLLVGAEGVGSVFWVDIRDRSYKRISLEDSGGVSDRRFIGLSSDGNKFAYVTGFLDKDKEQRIDLYDLRNGNRRTLLTLSHQEGNLLFPRFSPSGDFIAYLVETRFPNAAQVLQIYDLNNRTNQTLFQGDMGLQEPVWSPNGMMIAVYVKDSERGFVHVPSVGNLWFGNIWIVHVPSAVARQVTSIEGVAYRPLWAQDGRTLAFITHDGQIGLTRVDGSGGIWLVTSASANYPLFTSMFFVP